MTVGGWYAQRWPSRSVGHFVTGLTITPNSIARIESFTTKCEKTVRALGKVYHPVEGNNPICTRCMGRFKKEHKRRG